MAQLVRKLPAMQETWVWSLGQEDPPEKGMATHTSIAWRIPWTEESGGSQRVRLDWATNTLHTYTFTYIQTYRVLGKLKKKVFKKNWDICYCGTRLKDSVLQSAQFGLHTFSLGSLSTPGWCFYSSLIFCVPCCIRHFLLAIQYPFSTPFLLLMSSPEIFTFPISLLARDGHANSSGQWHISWAWLEVTVMGKLSFPVKRFRTVFSIFFFGFELRFDGWPSHDHGRKAKGISREGMIVKVLNNSFSYCLPLDFVMRGKQRPLALCYSKLVTIT